MNVLACVCRLNEEVVLKYPIALTLRRWRCVFESFCELTGISLGQAGSLIHSEKSYEAGTSNINEETLLQIDIQIKSVDSSHLVF